MSPSPFTVPDSAPKLPPDPSPDPATAVQQVWDAARSYWNSGAAGDYDLLGGLSAILAQALA